MSSLAGIAIGSPAEGAACDRCGLTDDPGRVTLSFPEGVLTCRERTVSFHLCVWCCAELLGTASGFKTGQQIRRWYRMRRGAGALARADNPHGLGYLRGGRAVEP